MSIQVTDLYDRDPYVYKIGDYLVEGASTLSASEVRLRLEREEATGSDNMAFLGQQAGPGVEGGKGERVSGSGLSPYPGPFGAGPVGSSARSAPPAPSNSIWPPILVTLALGMLIFLAIFFLSPYSHPERSVVLVDTDTYVASAVYLGGNRWLTAAHVAENILETNGRLVVGDTELTVDKVIFYDDATDTAIIRTEPGAKGLVTAGALTPAVLECRLPVRGETITVAGYSLSTDLLANPWTADDNIVVTMGRVATGLIDYKYGSYTVAGVFLATAVADHGGSGGAVFDRDGEVIGVVSFGPISSAGYGGVQISNLNGYAGLTAVCGFLGTPIPTVE